MNIITERNIRNWFVRGCSIETGLKILKAFKVDRKILSSLKSKSTIAPKQVIELLAKIIGSVNPMTMELDFNFDTIDFDQTEKKSAISPLPTATPVPSVVPDIPPPIVTAPVQVDSPDTAIEYLTALSSIYEPKEKNKEKKREPKVIKELRKKAIKLHKQHSYLKFELGIVESDRKRYFIAREIMEEIIPELDKIYKNIRYWDKTGETPEIPKKEEFKKGVDTILKKESLRTRIAKINRILKRRLPNEKRVEYEKELLDKELELEDIIQLLNTL